jgi:hypothetical protein
LAANNYFRSGGHLADSSSSLDPIHCRESNVQQNQIRPQFRRFLDSPKTVVYLANDLELMILRFQWFIDTRPELCAAFHDPTKVGVGGRRLFSVLDENKLRRVLAIMLDENEFLSPYGIRSLLRYHATHPYVFRLGDREYNVSYLPAESDTGMFGGNSNWRGPVWMPVNMLILRALVNYYAYYGDTFTVECPTGSGRRMNFYQVAEEIARRMVSIFLRDSHGQRPVYGGARKFQEDPDWRGLILFYEYFHGDNGAGIGASHQTGWTGIVAQVMHMFATTTAQQVIALGQKATIVETESSWSVGTSSDSAS